MKIGFFDSGLGGLTVLKEALENEGLCEEIYYLGDTRNTPYGVKDEEFVREAIHNNIDYLVNIGCNPIVIACNTATALCIKELREKYKNITLIGTEPAIKVAADSKQNKKILVLATSITVKKEKLHSLIEKLDIKDKVELCPADKLVTFAEDINCNNMSEEVEEYIESIIGKYNLKEYSHIVLGCTHFPLFKDNFNNVIKKIDSKSNIKLVDGAKGISNNIMSSIEKIENRSKDIKGKKQISVILTSKNDDFIVRAEQILKEQEINYLYKLQ